MAEPYIPTIKDFDFFFKFLFAYFFLQVWALLTGQDANLRETLKGKKAASKIKRAFKIAARKLSKKAEERKKREELAEERKKREELANQRKYLFQFIFLSTSMFIFAFVMIGFLDVPARDVANIAVFIFVTASLLKYLFDYTVTESQVRMIILSGLALYVDSFRETAERIASQF